MHDSGFSGVQKVGFGAMKLLYTGLSLGNTVTIPPWMNGWMQVAAGDLKAGENTQASLAVTACFVHSLAICGALLAVDAE